MHTRLPTLAVVADPTRLANHPVASAVLPFLCVCVLVSNEISVVGTWLNFEWTTVLRTDNASMPGTAGSL